MKIQELEKQVEKEYFLSKKATLREIMKSKKWKIKF
jgi:hypothetical protein